MNFLLDLQVLQSESRLRGIGRYSRGLAGALLEGYGGNGSALLNLSLGDPQVFDDTREWLRERLPDRSVHAFTGLTNIQGRLPTQADKRSACALCYDAYVAALGVDIVHIASPFEGYADDTVAGWGELTGPARAATLYDFIPLQQPNVHLANPLRADWYKGRLAELSKADVLLAISAATRDVAIEMLGIAPDRIINIGADCDPGFKKVDLSPEARKALFSRYKISKPFVIHVGPAEPRKNVTTLIQAFAKLEPKLRAAHQLLLAGEMTEAQREEIAVAVRKCRIDPTDVLVPGFVPDLDLIPLYSLTRVAVMPSYLEGFGLPLLEAMRCGAPVLGANASSLPEVIGQDELMFDPRRANRLAEKLTLMLRDEGFRARALSHCQQQQKKFSWQRSAAVAHAALSEAAARHKAETRVLPNGKRQYVVVPRHDVIDDPGLSDAIAQLRSSGDVAIALPDDAQVAQRMMCDVPVVDFAAIDSSAKQRVVIVGSPESLDINQQKAVAKTPAVLLKSQAAESSSSSIEVKYRLGGYPALQGIKNPVAFTPPVTGCLYPNLIAALGTEAGLAERIERAFASHPLGFVPALLDRLRSLQGLDPSEVAIAIAENQSDPIAPRLLVDLSSLVRHDAGSGIQRVVKAILTHLFTEKHEWCIEPIYRDGSTYRYARKFCCNFLNVDGGELTDAIVDFHPTDTFLGLDLDPELTDPAVALLHYHRRRGMRVVFIIYDLLPILRGEWFGSYIASLMTRWLDNVLSVADQVIAISRSVADDVSAFLDSPKAPLLRRPMVSWWHLGADFMVTVAAHPAPQALAVHEAEALAGLKDRTVFLTVGTIEPRKGISQLLDAAEEFWRTHDATFVIVGKKGWLVDDLMARKASHPEFGKRLLWFDHPSDVVLDRLYDLATAALLPSEGEGFGLPLIEAARRNTPIIARDLPVFREIGGTSVFYFSAKTGAELGEALRAWIAMHERGEAPKPDLKVATWRESTLQLLGVINANKVRRGDVVNK